jgi:hypothetical protein
MPRAVAVEKKSFDEEATIEGFSQNVRDLISVNEAEQQRVAVKPFERGTSRSGSYRLDAQSRLRLRGCIDLCEGLFLETGRE